MEIINIDFRKCKYIRELHNEIQTKMNLPNNYGKNLDALWDMIEYYCDYPVQINFYGTKNRNLDISDYIKKIIVVFRNATISSPNMSYKIIS